jgi:hypothetical protein
MADNVTLPGTGAEIASDDIGGKQFQRVKLVHGADGVNAGDVATANPLPTQELGESVGALEALRMAITALTRTIGMALPSAQGWPIMEARQPTAANLQATVSGTVTSNIGTGTLAAVTTVTTVTGVTTLTNQTQMGGFAANDYIPALMHLQADNLRRNISVT